MGRRCFKKQLPYHTLPSLRDSLSAPPGGACALWPPPLSLVPCHLWAFWGGRGWSVVYIYLHAWIDTVVYKCSLHTWLIALEFQGWAQIDNRTVMYVNTEQHFKILIKWMCGAWALQLLYVKCIATPWWLWSQFPHEYLLAFPFSGPMVFPFPAVAWWDAWWNVQERGAGWIHA